MFSCNWILPYSCISRHYPCVIVTSQWRFWIKCVIKYTIFIYSAIIQLYLWNQCYVCDAMGAKIWEHILIKHTEIQIPTIFHLNVVTWALKVHVCWCVNCDTCVHGNVMFFVTSPIALFTLRYSKRTALNGRPLREWVKMKRNQADYSGKDISQIVKMFRCWISQLELKTGHVKFYLCSPKVGDKQGLRLPNKMAAANRG